MTDLLDVNVWVPLSLRTHSMHSRAMEYWTSASLGELAFCRVSALGFVRVSTNVRALMGTRDALQEAWGAYRGLLRHPGISILQEPPDLEAYLDRWVGSKLVSSRTWTDAYLAAFAISANMRLVTFDRDFRRFPELNTLILEQ